MRYGQSGGEGCLDGEGSAEEVLVDGLDAEKVDDAGEEEEDHEKLRTQGLSFDRRNIEMGRLQEPHFEARYESKQFQTILNYEHGHVS